MKKSKIILLYSLLIISVIRINNIKISKYNIKSNEITGKIINCNEKNNKTKIIIKGKEKVLININQKYKCTIGTTIKAYGTIKKPENNTVFYAFNYKKYLLSQNIKIIFDADKIRKIKKNENIINSIKNKINNHLNKYESKAYLKAFILGDQNDINEEINENYREIGISHLLAISGMQITLLMTVISYILKNSSLKIIILIFYTSITSKTPSIIRSALFYISSIIKKKYKINISNEQLLLIIGLMMITYNPYYIYNLGFKLSFTISLSIIMFRKTIFNTKNYIKKIFITSLLSFISSIPIIVNTNFKINLLTPIFNIYFIPLISLLIYPLAIITFFYYPLDKTLHKLIRVIEYLSIKLKEIKILTFYFGHINIIEIIIYYVVITFVMIKIGKNKKIYIILIIIMTIIHYNINYFKEENKIAYINIGQGDSILIKLKNNKGNMLIDTGGNSYKTAKKTIIPYLKAEGIKKLQFLIISHGDADHCGEAINLVNNFKVEKVIFNCGSYNNLEKDLIKVLDKKKIPYYSCIKELNIDNKKIYFLQTKEYDNENDNSNVIYTELDGYKFMFMGDAGVTTEKEILKEYNLPDIDVLKVGHHGSRTSSSKEFINEINPKYSIISVGKNNRYGHPNKEVLNNLEDSKIYRTDQDGSIMFKFKNNKLKIETCSP